MDKISHQQVKPDKPVPSDSRRLMYALIGTLSIARGLSAIYSPIQDCDETFNFLEPTHYLSHGFGLQTWEFSPEYRIRSWLYIALHALPVSLIQRLLQVSKTAEFYILRGFLASTSTICESLLLLNLWKFVSPRLAILAALISIYSAGFFHATVAYLPSSFAMYTMMLATSEFLRIPRRFSLAKCIMWVAAGAVFGWPFIGVLVSPFVLSAFIDSIRDRNMVSMAGELINGFMRAVSLLVLEIVFDSMCYGKLTSVPFNIVVYNVFGSSDKGPDIFGTEPWHFYPRNLLINFNVWFILAMLSAPLISIRNALGYQSSTRISSHKLLLLTTPFYIWLAIFTLQPHKEERFMYPVYPSVVINAALSLHVIIIAMSRSGPDALTPRRSVFLRLLILSTFLASAAAIGLWRILGLATAYAAPVSVYGALTVSSITQTHYVCVGKEWYRYPSSYHLPHGARLKFLKSEFDGLLPGEFDESNDRWLGVLPPVWTLPLGMNDRNEEDHSKYVTIDHCDYLIDFNAADPSFTALEPDYIGDVDTWESVRCEPFLDITKTGTLGRLFWLPNTGLVPSQIRRHWGSYCLLKRRKIVSY